MYQIKTLEKISYIEAKRKVTSTNVIGVNYARAAKSNQENIKSMVEELIPSLIKTIDDRISKVLTATIAPKETTDIYQMTSQPSTVVTNIEPVQKILQTTTIPPFLRCLNLTQTLHLLQQ